MSACRCFFRPPAGNACFTVKDRNCRSFARRAPDERNPSKYGALRRIRTSDRSVRSRVREAGRGFAVVADEVRNLAHRAQESAQQIQKMIEELQIGAQEAVSTMTESQRYSLESVEIANRAGERLSTPPFHGGNRGSSPLGDATSCSSVPAMDERVDDRKVVEAIGRSPA